MGTCCQVDGVVVGTTPLVPAQLVQGWGWQGGAGRHLLQTLGTSVFFFMFLAPTTPGVHNITVIATVSGTAQLVTASQVGGGSSLCLRGQDSMHAGVKDSLRARTARHQSAAVACQATPPCCCAQAATLTVLAPPTVALTFGNGQTIGTFGPLCKAPVTATATVTGVTGFATPTGNVTLLLQAINPGLHPANTIIVQTVRPLLLRPLFTASCNQ